MIIDDYLFGECPPVGWWCMYPTLNDALFAFSQKLVDDLILIGVILQ